jgi:AcrR family transcriptional regulator
MARPKAFDREQALRAAVGVFWRRGYAATAAADLARAMGIGRQSFYDTFGDRRQCYLEALRTYARDEVGAQFAAAGLEEAAGVEPAAAGSGPGPLERLRAFLRYVAERPDERRLLGCMIVNAIAEEGGEPDVVAALGPSSGRLRETLVGLLQDAKARGEVAPTLDEEQAAHSLLFTRMGLMLSAKARRPPALLRQVADFAVDQLRAPAAP